MFGKLYHIYSVYNIFSELDKLQHSTLDVDINKLKTLKTKIFSGGCLNIKFAQWYISKIKSNTDNNSKDIVDYFEDIFEQCPRHSDTYTINLFENDFKQPLSTLIDISTLKCIASGSIGQVYKCKLLNPIYIIDSSHKNIKNIINKYNISINNVINDYWISYDAIPDYLKPISKIVEYIALKVKHPGINEDIEYKVSCVNILTSIQNNSYLKSYLGLHVDFADFINNLTQQINFYNEYNNSFIFRKNFAGNYLVYFPRVFWCSENILITEFTESSDISTLSLFNQLKACTNFACAISQMILIDNFCHGDIHNKNWGITLYSSVEDNMHNEPKLIFYDYGICFRSDNRQLNIDLWENFENCNIEGIVNISEQLIIGTYNKDEVHNELETIIQFFKKYSLDILNLIHNINNVLNKHNCKLSSILLNIVITLSLIDSILKKQNIIGGNGAEVAHKMLLRQKQLDLIAYCTSKHIYNELTQYLTDKRKRQTLHHKENNAINNDKPITAFGQSNVLELDLPE